MLDTTLDAFLSHLYTEKAYKKASYYGSLFRKAELYFAYVEFDEKNCQKFLLALDISPSGYNNDLKALKLLARFLGHAFLDRYKQKRAEQPYIPILDEKEAIKLIYEAYRYDYRRGVAIEVFLRTGLRANELITLEWRDYHTSTLYIHNTKTSRSRTIEILPDLTAKIETLRGNHPRYIFATNRGMLDRKELNTLIAELLNKLKIGKHITVHKLRHSFSTLLDEKGVSLRTIQELLGHTTITTTQGYIHTTTAAKKDAAKKISYGEYKLSYDEVTREIMKHVELIRSDEVICNVTKQQNVLKIEMNRK